MTMTISEIIKSLPDDSVERQKIANSFFNSTMNHRRFAVGKNSESLQLHSLVTLSGIIDDYSPKGSRWNGIPLLHTSAVPIDAFIVNCSTSISPVNVEQHLKKAGFKNIVPYCSLVLVSNNGLSMPEFVKSFKKEIELYPESWQKIYDSLADDTSQKSFLDIIRYRYTADPQYMSDYSVRIDQQYFEEFMNYKQEVFVDAGGFDGDTSKEFCERYGDYKKIIFFEPATKNMALARQRLLGFDRIDFHNIGLSDAKGELRFNPENGSASSISDSGSETIRVDTLDNIVTESVSVIKMDLEGWELNALRGSEGHIRRELPKLAIAVYHDSSDFRLIFEYILSIHPKYKVYLRHYTQGWSETVMFFKH
jgi:FkbM family methyltransferase